MAEKCKLTQEMLDGGKSFEALGFELYNSPVPYSVLVDAAFEFADNAFVLDPLGIVYENYSYDLEWCYVCIKYFSNLDIDGWDKETLYNRFAHDIELRNNANLIRLQDMVRRMYDILKARVERENSLDYQLGQAIEMLKESNIQESRDATEKIITLMDRVKETEKKPVLTMFAKKE